MSANQRRLSSLVIILFIFLGIEIGLRKGFGFGGNVLVQEDPNFEYIAKPNQARKRFGNEIYYNQFSMRSDNPIPGTIKVLGLGDSVLNGGALTSQEDLATTLLSGHLSEEIICDVQVLNISYKSWGPDNALAYLKKYGDFGAEMIFIVVSSHDSFDTMTFKKVVGLDRKYPSEQYFLATFEVLDAYLLPRLQKITKLEPKKESTTTMLKEKSFNTGFAGLLVYSTEKKLPLIVYLHPEKSEVEKGAYNREGQMIIEFARNNNILLIEGLEGAKEEYYRDNIHINKIGQKHLYSRLFPVLKSFLSTKRAIAH